MASPVTCPNGEPRGVRMASPARTARTGGRPPVGPKRASPVGSEKLQKFFSLARIAELYRRMTSLLTLDQIRHRVVTHSF